MSDTATISMFERLVFAAEALADTHPGLADLLSEAADALVNIAADRDSWEQQASDRTDDAVTFAAAARLAIKEKRAFALCIEGRNGSTATLHNLDDATICARMLERFARLQRGTE